MRILENLSPRKALLQLMRVSTRQLKAREVEVYDYAFLC